ncbi:uncharacterized protein LOC128679814 [Plodia interpunctella]|uniref:uncharacterized protein LOC128673264 n=1 Tax=Plodia interpunctella TaxID=58824 RepID=UPI0023685030|nr:uncharacterized protein LOC128673264 [Plodia interpunctella]XP_053618246.1 uncharacterized protein LOC128679814 [Plodia interpunctella]
MWKPNFSAPSNQNIQYRGPSRTQQIFGAPPPNYNPRSNVFALPQRPQNANNAPRPMSGVSHFAPKPLPPSGHDWRRFGNPPPSNYFKTREMNVNECYDYQYDPYNDSYDNQPYFVTNPDLDYYEQTDNPYDNNEETYPSYYEPREIAENSCGNDQQDFHKGSPSDKQK